MNRDTEQELTHLRDRVEELSAASSLSGNEYQMLSLAVATLDDALQHSRSARNVKHDLSHTFTHAPIACAGFCNPQVSPSHWRAQPAQPETNLNAQLARQLNVDPNTGGPTNANTN